MRSPVDRGRGERLARAAVLGALALLLVRNWTPAGERPDVVLSQERLPDALREWTTGSAPQRAHLQLSEVPGPTERDWLRALQRAGTRIGWSGRIEAPAIEVGATAEPHSAYLLRTAGARGDPVWIADRSRTIAELTDPGPLAVLRSAALVGAVEAQTSSAAARSPLPPPPAVRRIALFGPAGWETKFLLAALEESGWTVDARIAVAPGVNVGPASSIALDTARYSVAIVVDAVPAEVIPALIRFARMGGGVIVAGRAVTATQLAGLLPARAAAPLAVRDTSVVTEAALGGAALALAEGAVSLQQRGNADLVAAARIGIGRVAAIGYFDTWRWRLQGGDDAVAAHRDWWSSLAAAVAYAPDTADFTAPESAPLASFVAALGPPGERVAFRARRSRWIDPLLFALVGLGLLGEVVSRRTRGLV